MARVGEQPGFGLVFLHYFGGSARAWDGVIARLEGAFDCAPLDFRGFGAERNAAGPYSVDAYADDVASLIERRDLERIVLIGHSMGGKVALAVAARRLAALGALVLIAPSPPTPEPMGEDVRVEMLAAHGDRDAMLGIARRITASPLPPALLDQVADDMILTAPTAWSAWLREGSRETVAMGAGRLAVPALVVTGTEDTTIPRGVLESDVMPVLSDGRLVAVAGAGHLLPLEAPERVAAVIEAAARNAKESS